MLDDAGARYQQTLPAAQRRAGGVFYTPADVARNLVAVATDGLAIAPPRRPMVCDPACGAGALLLAAAEQLERAGHDRATIVGDLIWGADIDGAAVAVARRALADWAADGGATATAIHVVVGDGLVADGPWPEPPPDGFDLVVGNPPFQSQLAAPTARGVDQVAAVRRRFGEVAAPYADSATLFLVRGCELARAGGRVAMIQPESVLAARDAGPARAVVRERAALIGLWWAGEPVFDAGVRVCAPVLEVGVAAARRHPLVRRWRGRAFEPVASIGQPDPCSGSSWSPLLASLRGTPAVELEVGSPLAAMATASAGFRDEYYGLVPFVAEAEDAAAAARPAVAKLVTSGLIEPMRSRWGSTPTRFARTSWQAPVVDMQGLRVGAPRVAAWGEARLVPKVLVAGQTRVLEVAVDTEGSWWPSVPTIAVVPRSADPADLWLLAAALSAPATSVWALSQFGGAALSSDAVKVSASQAASAPMPTDREAWAAGAASAAAADEAGELGDRAGWRDALTVLGEAMGDAYGVGSEVTDWWEARRPAWR